MKPNSSSEEQKSKMPMIHKLRLSKTRSIRKIPCSSAAGPSESASISSGGPHYSLTSTLNDDLLASVLSFVSYAPYEQQFLDQADHHRLYSAYLDSSRAHLPPRGSPAHFFSKEREKPKPRLLEHSFGTLTHVLPLVCKKFCKICIESDVLWSESIERLTKNDPDGWKLALSGYEQGYEKNEECDSSDQPISNIATLVSKACLNFHASLYKSSKEDIPGSVRLFFKSLAKEARPIRFQGPIFQMRTGETLRIGKPIGLHLFEPRYRLLIKEAMHGRSKYEKSGILIGNEKPRPQFLFSFGVSLPLVSGDPAVIVELTRCHIYDDGRADVTIIPVMHATFSRVWEREGSHRLMEAEATAAPRIRQRSPASLRAPQLVTGPVFGMRSPRAPPLGIEFRLHLFEPRYFAMIAELTQDLAEAYRTGVVIPDGSSNHVSKRKLPRPLFICSYGRVCAPGEKAVILEVRRCYIRGNMTADVTVVPVQKGIIESVEEFPLSVQTARATIKIRESLESI